MRPKDSIAWNLTHADDALLFSIRIAKRPGYEADDRFTGTKPVKEFF